MPDIMKAMIEILVTATNTISAKGQPKRLEWRAADTSEPALPKYDHRATSLADAFPKAIRALRDASTPRYSQPDGRSIAELTATRFMFQSPLSGVIPHYWIQEREAFNDYFSRAFSGPTSLFGARFLAWGASENKQGTNQVCRAMEKTLEAINQKRVDRRIVLVTAQPPGESAFEPLGLSAVHVFPRLLSGDPQAWKLDFIWIWRSVEAIVGFPFSAYGSVRWSNEFLESVIANLPPAGKAVTLGTVTYVAISLHLYCDRADLEIARQIDLEARP